MEDNKNFDLDDIINELSNRLEDIIEDILIDQVESAIACSVQDFFEEGLNESLSRYEFELANGTVVRPRQYMKLLSPDKSKLLLCYGGLRVDGLSLLVQTRATCWDRIASYSSKEEAIKALTKVKDAMAADIPIFEL